MKISIEKCGEYKSVSVVTSLNDVEDYKIISSADGSTELIIDIKTDEETVKYDLSTNREAYS